MFFLVGCGSSKHGFEDPGKTVDDGGNPDLAVDGAMKEAGLCEGLDCLKVECGAGETTTVSGAVFDPAGKNPLYNVVVYVPNAALQPIAHGPVCDSCGGASPSGKPIVTALTDARGKFVLKDVPVTKDLPIVVQAGKWRRTYSLPSVAKCADNPIPEALRLPRNQNEFGGANAGTSMPLIALTTGCDPMELLIRKIGIDKSEFTTKTGSGMVHVYKGKIPDGLPPDHTGLSNAADAYAFYASKSEMLKYDIIINACECQPLPRDTVGPFAYANFEAYLNAGGRMFNTHYHLNQWGADNTNMGKAAMSLQTAATWSLWNGSDQEVGPLPIDTSFPKGKAMDDWLENLKTASAWPNIKATPKGQVFTGSSGDIQSAKAGISQRWVYTTNGSSVAFLSFNTPTTAPPDKRCGRAVGGSMHVANESLTTMFEQEAVLEFMFFDVAACVIDDGTVPVPPAPH